MIPGPSPDTAKQVFIAIVASVLAAAVGGALGLIPGSSPEGSTAALRPIRTFAFVAALAIVLGHLMPEAIEAAGLGAIAAFFGSFVAAVFLDRLTHDHGPRPKGDAASGNDEHGHGHAHGDAKVPIAIELGFAALAVHRLIDGVAFAHYVDRPVILAAFAAHSIPVTALVVVTYRDQSRRAAIIRAVLLTLACVAGVVLHDVIPMPSHAAEGWIAAVVSGLLLHVVTHGWEDEAASTATGWLLEALAVAAGVAFLFMAETHSHEHHGHDGDDGHEEHGQDSGHEGHDDHGHDGPGHDDHGHDDHGHDDHGHEGGHSEQVVHRDNGDHEEPATIAAAHALHDYAPGILLVMVIGFGVVRTRRRTD